jgi:signal transduction histidine kinase
MIILLLIQSAPLPELPGEKARCVAAIFDIHDRKEAEIRTREAHAQAEAANKAKSAFLANMSHELRTPLNAIIGFSEIMQAEMLGPVGNARYKEYLGDVVFSAKHLLSVINDVLDITKIEADKLDMLFEAIDPLEVINSALSLIKESAQRGQVNIAAELPDALPKLRADKRRFRQILLNLLSNAIKFTPIQGTVTLLAYVAKDGQLRLVINDTGIGVEPDQIALIMTPFGQIDSELSRRYEGTGLGLPLARFLTEKHGGELVFESRPGIGSKVTLSFPPS